MIEQMPAMFSPETLIEVEKTVDRLLVEHVGGPKFFDALDASWRERERMHVVFDLVRYAARNCAGYCFVSSGRFGMFLHNAFEAWFPKNLLLATGGLRTSAPMCNFDYARGWIKDTHFIFLDDSFYSGKTRNLIKAELERHGGFLDHTLVIYDGCKVKDADVTSIYRYWDYYSPQ